MRPPLWEGHITHNNHAALPGGGRIAHCTPSVRLSHGRRVAKSLNLVRKCHNTAGINHTVFRPKVKAIMVYNAEVRNLP